jgi:hypothetical protein
VGLAACAYAYPLADSADPYAAPPQPPPQYAPAQKPYGPPPKSYAPSKGYKEEALPPQPYQFEYGVSDQVRISAMILVLNAICTLPHNGLSSSS